MPNLLKNDVCQETSRLSVTLAVFTSIASVSYENKILSIVTGSLFPGMVALKIRFDGLKYSSIITRLKVLQSELLFINIEELSFMAFFQILQLI